MKDDKLIPKIDAAVRDQHSKRGYITPVDVLMDAGVLEKRKYEDWRFGRHWMTNALGGEGRPSPPFFAH